MLGIVELEANLGKAKDFITFDADSGELQIEPDESHAGDYTIKMKLLDSYEEYEKKMLLKVVGKVLPKDDDAIKDQANTSEAQSSVKKEDTLL